MFRLRELWLFISESLRQWKDPLFVATLASKKLPIGEAKILLHIIFKDIHDKYTYIGAFPENVRKN
jgi:hypothetical protein